MLPSLTTCLRHRSATETPASCSFKIPMIYSSEKRLRFMLWAAICLLWDYRCQRIYSWVGICVGALCRGLIATFTPSKQMLAATSVSAVG